MRIETEFDQEQLGKVALSVNLTMNISDWRHLMNYIRCDRNDENIRPSKDEERIGMYLWEQLFFLTTKFESTRAVYGPGPNGDLKKTETV